MSALTVSGRMSSILGDLLDHVAVFGMDHCSDAKFSGPHHNVEEVAITELHRLVCNISTVRLREQLVMILRGLTRHIYFYAGNSLLHKLR